MINKIITLDVPFQFAGTGDTIHPVVLIDDNSMVLVDCSYTGFLPNIEKAMAACGLDCRHLTHVVITHHDHDHMGALSALKDKYPAVQIVSGVAEEPYISGKTKSLRLEQAEILQETLPEAQKQFGLEFCNILRRVTPVNVDITVSGGDVLNWCGGCTVLDTAGHTPGHISLLLEKQGILIAGDAAVVENGSLGIANPQFTPDLEGASDALKKILSSGAREIICYHGGIFHV